uniref:Uncharacterized protein n=1 Tax=Romanomermis culicivorax TaxID=13658 RepID=A0A915L723_ROMCU
MDPGNIIDSFLYPTEVIPFEFLFNDHFVLDVFNYIPYVTSFLFGIFCYLETSNLRFKSGFYDVEHMFNMKGQVDVVKWAWVVKSGDQRQLIFFNFYFGPNFDQSQKQTISELEFSNLMDKLPAGARNIDGTFFYEYYFYHDEPRYYDPVTLKLAVKNPSRSMNGSRSKGLLGRAAEEFLAYRDEVSLDKLLYTVDQFWISSRNRSWQSKNNPSKACGFIHGLFFFAQYVQQARLEIYRHQNKDFEKFFLVVYSLAAPAPIYTISFNKGEYVNHYNSETKSEKTSLIPALPSFDQVSRNLEKSVVSEMIVQLHNNGRDYLTNLFENANNITRNEQLMQAFSVYLANIFDEEVSCQQRQNCMKLSQ